MADVNAEAKTKEQRKADAYEEFMKDFIQGYYDTKRDEDGMADFVKLLNLGCFGREFCVYGMAYEDETGTAYRASGKALNLHEFARTCGIEGIYPTPVFSNLQRRISPSGSEDMIKNILKKETAEELGNVNIITLTNEKNHLFNSSEYAEYEEEISCIFTQF